MELFTLGIDLGETTFHEPDRIRRKRRRLPSNGPIKTAPREISRGSSRPAGGSPDRVLSLLGTDPRRRNGGSMCAFA